MKAARDLKCIGLLSLEESQQRGFEGLHQVFGDCSSPVRTGTFVNTNPASDEVRHSGGTVSILGSDRDGR